MHKSFTIAIAILAAAQFGIASADHGRNPNKLLKGSFSFAFSQTCTYSPDGFTDTPDGPRVNGFTYEGTDYGSGVASFDGNGNMTITDKGIFQVLDSAFPQSLPSTSFQDQCTGTYSVNPDRSFSTDYTCTVTLLRGPSKGQTIVLNGLKNSGQIDPWGNSYVLSSVDDRITVLNFSSGASVPRLCGAMQNGVRIR